MKSNCAICGFESKSNCSYPNSSYYFCMKCNLIYLYPLPSIEKMHDYYDESYKSGAYSDYLDAHELKTKSFEACFKEITPFVSESLHFDLDCSNGAMIEIGIKNGFDSSGVEFSETAIQNVASDMIFHTLRDTFPKSVST